MPERQSSPEKELLRLIEDSKKSPSQINEATLVRRRRGFFSLNSWKGRFIFFRENLFRRKPLSLTYRFDIKLLNGILEFSVLILGFYLVNDVLRSVNSLNKIPLLNPPTLQVAKTIDFMQGGLLKKSSSAYLEKVTSRDIFNIVEKKKTTPLEKAVSEEAMEALKDLRLVGISWSENPDAMIEDTKAMRTFFVKRGQMIRDFKVKAIFKDRVVLIYKDEEVELK